MFLLFVLLLAFSLRKGAITWLIFLPLRVLRAFFYLIVVLVIMALFTAIGVYASFFDAEKSCVSAS